jgi:hypothetical protein
METRCVEALDITWSLEFVVMKTLIWNDKFVGKNFL